MGVAIARRAQGGRMRCKVGDLAIVIRPRVEANLGILVEVERCWNGRAGWWWVRSLSGPRMRKDGTVECEGAAEDTALWPIRGEPQPRREGKRVPVAAALED
jgi:hypothetical protein